MLRAARSHLAASPNLGVAMKLRLQVRHRRTLCRALALSLALTTFHSGAARAGPEALINTINVNTTADEYDASPNANCSLREAVRSANDNADFGGCNSTGIYGNDLINIPVGTYALTRVGIDDDTNSTADLDILASVALDGAGGAGDVVIKGGPNYSGRIVHVLAGTVVLKDMTLRDGNLPNGRAGAGLRTEPGSTTTLSNVVVGLNTADGNAGGILNRGTMTLNGCAVTNNKVLNATQGGGGLFNDDNATLTLNGSRVLNNTSLVIDSGSANATGGGGIFNDVNAALNLHDTTVDGNTTDGAAGNETALTCGGGVFSKGGVTIVQSTISNNSALGSTSSGGGIKANANTAIGYSLITGNTARGGGGVAAFGGVMQITDSIISNNNGGAGGGLMFAQNVATIIRSTISGNTVTGAGGGIYVVGVAPGSHFVTLVNTTVSGNSADSTGGGLAIDSDATPTVSLLSVTIAKNVSNADSNDDIYGTGGGGIYESGRPGETVNMLNSVVADNEELGAGNDDDCFGTIVSFGNNVIEHVSAGSCILSNAFASDLANIAITMGAFAANGGPVVGATTSPIVAGMGTHLPDGPLIDHGNPTGCKDQNGLDLLTDQRGFVRVVAGPDPDSSATCDTGAVEFGSFADLIFADSFD